jgi:hypothetical protein
MKTYYVTYKKNGSLKRGVLSESQYKLYSSNSLVSDLEIHPNQQVMEEYFSGNKGKKILLG